MFTIAKLMKILKPYVEAEQLSHFDKNLFHSFYSPVSLEDKPKANMIRTITDYLKEKIALEDSLTNVDLLQDASLDASKLEPLQKIESIMAQNTNSLLSSNHSLRHSEKTKTSANDATVEQLMTHKLAVKKVYPDKGLDTVKTKSHLI
jgi:hypothetical protein